MLGVTPLNTENKVSQSHHVRESCSSLNMPLGVGNHIVASNTARVASCILYILNMQVPPNKN